MNNFRLSALTPILALTSFMGSANAVYIHNGYEYMITVGSYAPTANWAAAAIAEFGPAAKVVDWNTIKSEFGGSVSNLDSFLDGIGYTQRMQGDGRGVTRNGSQIWSGTRSYGIDRAEGTVPGGYLVHDQLQNNWLLLGSWPVNRQLVVQVPVPEPSQALLVLAGIAFLGTWLNKQKRMSGSVA